MDTGTPAIVGSLGFEDPVSVEMQGPRRGPCPPLLNTLTLCLSRVSKSFGQLNSIRVIPQEDYRVEVDFHQVLLSHLAYPQISTRRPLEIRGLRLTEHTEVLYRLKTLYMYGHCIPRLIHLGIQA